MALARIAHKAMRFKDLARIMKAMALEYVQAAASFFVCEYVCVFESVSEGGRKCCCVLVEVKIIMCDRCVWYPKGIAESEMCVRVRVCM